jgi:phenylalanyl-tRNA synthetase beta chain
MKMPLSLIKSFIHIDLQPAQIAETLTLLGLEVDGIENEHPSFSGVVVGEVLSTVPHPNASKLTVAQVSDGTGAYQVVCGAANCRTGLKTAFAKPGALLRDPDGKQRKIEKAAVRGVESFGMLTSEEELGIPSQTDGIIELPSDIEAGKDLVPLLWDPVFEISLTPNLGHCMCALGVARELSAALSLPIRKPEISLKRDDRVEKTIKVGSHDLKLCPRYMCRIIENVSIAPSPFWLQRQLLACGLAPISNAVDIANYIMLTLGQPLHVFDYDKIENSAIRIGASDAPQTFLGLDQVEREVPAGTLLISDGQKPVAIAGILGGENSAVTGKTHHILVEAAVFDPAIIRRAIKNLDVRTESAQRFEKGIDPNGTPEALDAACALIAEICKGREASAAIDSKKSAFAPKEILCRTERVNRLLGTHLSLNEIEEIFHRLGFSSKSIEKGALQVSVPLRRSDIAEEIDLVEEVARIYGYNHIEKPTARCSTSHIPHDPAYLFEKEVRERLVGFGLQEFLNSDLISKKLAEYALEWVRPGASLLAAIHAKTEEYSVLRPSLLPGLLQSVNRNCNYRNHALAAFEIGRIHFLQNGQLVEEPMAALILTGKAGPSDWSRKTSNADFFDLKGYLENLFEAMRIPAPVYQPSAHPTFHPGRQADIYCGSLLIGSFGEIHPSLLESTDIKQRILYAETNLHLLMQQPRPQARMKPLSPFPSSERDWTVSLPVSTLIETLFDQIRSASTLLLEKAELIDLYVPEPGHGERSGKKEVLPNGPYKNATFRFTYRDPLKTISFEEVENAHTKLISRLQNSLPNEPISE